MEDKKFKFVFSRMMDLKSSLRKQGITDGEFLQFMIQFVSSGVAHQVYELNAPHDESCDTIRGIMKDMGDISISYLEDAKKGLFNRKG